MGAGGTGNHHINQNKPRLIKTDIVCFLSYAESKFSYIFCVCVQTYVSMAWELRGAVTGKEWENKYAQRTTIQMKCHKNFVY